MIIKWHKGHTASLPEDRDVGGYQHTLVCGVAATAKHFKRIVVVEASKNLLDHLGALRFDDDQYHLSYWAGVTIPVSSPLMASNTTRTLGGGEMQALFLW